MTVIHLADGRKAPLPDKYTLNRALKLLIEAGHTPVMVVFADGTRKNVKVEAA